MSFIQARNVVKNYGTGESLVRALRGVDFEIGMGEFISVMGESGSGKSTLLSIMGALNTPTEGDFIVDGIDIYRLTPDRRADFRREYLGFVFQSFNLIPYLTLAENAMLPLATVRGSRRKKRMMAGEALERVGLGTKADRLPEQVSGGEQERVAVARAIVNNPPILLADEPTGNLDAKTGSQVMALLKKLNTEGMTTVMVTHSEENAKSARRILRISDGLLVGDKDASRRGPAPASACRPLPEAVDKAVFMV